MTRNVAVAEAKARFSELLARVAHGGERIVIERHGKPVAALVAVADLERIERAGGAAADPWARLAEPWDGPPDEAVDRMVDLIYAERARNVRPPPRLADD